MRPAIILAATLALTAGAARAQDAASVEALVTKLYDGYRPGGDLEKSAKVLPFDDSLNKLIVQVDKVNSEGVGFDPFCACQDWEISKLAVKAMEVMPQSATVVARFVNFDEQVSITYKLVMTPKGWRIHDLILPEAPSFRALMVEAGKP